MSPLVEAAIARWSLPPVTRITQMGGTSSNVYRLDTEKGSWALRCIPRPPRPLNYAESAAKWLERLAEKTPVSLPTPYPARSGRYVEPLPPDPESGIVPQASLSNWVPGTVVEDPKPEHFFAYGQTLAHLHDATIEFTPPSGFVRRTWNAEGLFGNDGIVDTAEGWAILSNDARAVFRSVQTATHRVFETLGRGPEQFGMMHADLHAANAPIHNGQAGAIDFDDCGWGWFAFDLSIPLANQASESGGSDPAKETALFTGYQTIRPLPETWKTNLPLFMVAWQASVLVWDLAIEAPQERSALAERWRPYIDRTTIVAQAVLARLS